MDEGHPAHPAPEDPLIGRVLDGRYTILRRLASGGMGQVYLGEQQGLGRTVAIKVLSTPPSEVTVVEFRERFFREARQCSRLTHPNTVRIYDYGQTSDHVYYIVMEYLDGQTLSTLLKQGPLEPLRVISLASQVCASLSEAHALGLIHRDLKPDNLIITRHADGREFVRVLDFGIAKDIRNADIPTRAGTLFGSPGYMSPEQILELELTPASDLYSLGALLYRMLTGVKAFAQKNPVAVINRQVHAPPPTFRESNPALPPIPSLEWVTLRCLEKDPLDRFCSASELARALRVCDLEHRGLLSSPDLRLLEGRLVLQPEDEALLRRFEAGTNTPPGASRRRRSHTTMDPEAPLPSYLSQRLKKPAILVLGGLLPLLAGSGGLLIGLMLVGLLLFGIARHPSDTLPPLQAPVVVSDRPARPPRPPAPPAPEQALEQAPETPEGPAPEAPPPAPISPPRPAPVPKPEVVLRPPPVKPPPADPMGETDLKDPFED